MIVTVIVSQIEQCMKWENVGPGNGNFATTFSSPWQDLRAIKRGRDNASPVSQTTQVKK